MEISTALLPVWVHTSTIVLALKILTVKQPKAPTLEKFNISSVKLRGFIPVLDSYFTIQLLIYSLETNKSTILPLL